MNSSSLETILENEEIIFSNVNNSHFTNKQKIRVFFSNLWSKFKSITTTLLTEDLDNSSLYRVQNNSSVSIVDEQSQPDEVVISIARDCNSNLTINFIVHIYENIPSPPISFTFERPVTLQRFKKEVNRVLKVKRFWCDNIIMWHTRVFKRDIRINDKETDRIILRYLMTNDKLRIIDNDALFETLQSWNDLVEITIMTKRSKLNMM